MANLSINAVVMTVISLAIGIVLIGSLLAPIAADTIEDLKDPANFGADGATWANLVGVTVIFAILGLIIVAVNTYTKK